MPLIVYVPWLPQSHGVRTSALVSIVDLMPTAIALFGIGPTVPDLAELEGTSLLPLLLQPTLAPGLWTNATFTPVDDDHVTNGALAAAAGRAPSMDHELLLEDVSQTYGADSYNPSVLRTRFR